MTKSSNINDFCYLSSNHILASTCIFLYHTSGIAVVFFLQNPRVWTGCVVEVYMVDIGNVYSFSVFNVFTMLAFGEFRWCDQLCYTDLSGGFCHLFVHLSRD